MSLATRCPACGTIFRVVQDQLKVSEGWVRCGQCHEVFHGIEALFDLDSDPAIAARRAARNAAPPPQVFAPARAPLPPEDEPPAAIVVPPSAAPAPHFGITRPASSPRPDSGPPSGFTPAPTPRPTRATPIAAAPPMRGTIAPRFAARLAEESARVQATRPPPPWPGAAVLAKDDFGPPQDFALTDVQDLATTPMGFDERPSDAPFPSAAEAPAARVVDTPDESDPDADALVGWPAAELDDTFTSPRARQPRPIVIADDTWHPHEAAAIDDAPPHDPQADISTMPSRLADDDDAEGPPTLASLLPDVDDWPPTPGQRSRSRARRKSANAAAPVDPRFLREAQRDARWNRPRVRVALMGALVALALVAAVQVAYPLRDTLSARWPATQPALAALCEQVGCTIEAPRAIASLALDGSSLTRTNTEHVLLFSADLHNRADHPVRMPSFDLTFMDLNGAVVARKVLSPEQIGIRQTALAPEAELHVHARIQVGTLDASGFQAEMFYP